MRIISDFKDFYDCLSDGSDSNVWVRQTSVIKIDRNEPLFRHGRGNPLPVAYDLWRKWENNYYAAKAEINFSLLIFCGQLIPFWRSETRIGYDFESFIAYRTEIMDEKPSKWDFHNYWKTHGERLFKCPLPEGYKGLNLKYKSPVLILSQPIKSQNYEVTLNPRLTDLEFHKHHEMHWVFQELERYLFNDMVEPCDPVVNITDKIKAESHGFRDKYSFRKEPRDK